MKKCEEIYAGDRSMKKVMKKVILKTINQDSPCSEKYGMYRFAKVS